MLEALVREGGGIGGLAGLGAGGRGGLDGGLHGLGNLVAAIAALDMTGAIPVAILLLPLVVFQVNEVVLVLAVGVAVVEHRSSCWTTPSCRRW